MATKLLFSAISKFLAGILLVGAMIFLPAGTFQYWRGWLLMLVLFAPMLIVGIILFIKNPGLLQRRLSNKEERKTQDVLVKLSGLMFIAGFAIAGFGHRWGWYVLPAGVSIGAAAILLLAYLLYAEVLHENTYLSRTIEVQAGQRVVDTGMYRVVRHPMYSATILLFLAMPLVLGSLYALTIFMVYPVIICRRIRDEEDLLAKELDGYADYQQKVKYRLIPYIW